MRNTQFNRLIATATITAILSAILPAMATPGGGGNKVTICHNTSSASNPYNIIEISENAVDTHINHHGDFVLHAGDKLGTETDATCNSVTNKIPTIRGYLSGKSDIDFYEAASNPTTFHTKTYDNNLTGVAAFQQFANTEASALNLSTLDARKLDTDKLKLTYDAQVKIYFVNEGAGYRNQMKLVTTGTSVVNEFAFKDIACKGNGCLYQGSGDMLPTDAQALKFGDYVDAGTLKAGTNLDFQLVVDGFRKATNTKTWYTDKTKNSDGLQHLIAYEYEGYLILGWEDLDGGGDKDYNDVVMVVDIGQNNLNNIASVDTTPPNQPVTNSPSSTPDTTPTMSGRAESGSTVIIKEGSTVLVQTTTDANGNWSVDIPTALSEGNHTLSITAKDGAGNTSSALSSTITITQLDTTNPDAPAITTSLKTNDTTPTLTGTAEPNSTVIIKEGDTELEQVTTDASGNWSITLPDDKALSEGNHTLSVTAKDPSNNFSSPLSITLTVDKTAPDLPTINADSNDNGTPKITTEDNTPTLTGTAEIGSVVTIKDKEGDYILGSAIAGSDGTWSFTCTTLSQGNHTLEITAKDGVGNVSSTLSVNLKINAPDTTAPVQPVVTSPLSTGNNASILTGNKTPTFTGTAEPNSTVKITENGSQLNQVTTDASGNWSVTLNILSEGNHSLSITATDVAGNISTPLPISLTVDTTAPDAPVITSSLSTNDTTPTIAGTAEANSTVIIKIDDTQLEPINTDSLGNWTVELPNRSPGNYTLTVTCKDSLGNTSTPTKVGNPSALPILVIFSD